MSQEKATTQQEITQSREKTGNPLEWFVWPEDCYIGSDFLPGTFANMPIGDMMMTTMTAMLDNQDFHQEIAYFAMMSLLFKSNRDSVDDIRSLFLATGYARDMVLSSQALRPSND